MPVHKIEVDEEVWQFLKKNAEPFEDTPNSVLKRMFFGGASKPHKNSSSPVISRDLPDFPSGVPRALTQTLEVIYGVRKIGLSRSEATNLAAQKHHITSQAILDKYCRQLGKRAYEIDRMLEPENSRDLQSLLGSRYSNHRELIDDFFKSL